MLCSKWRNRMPEKTGRSGRRAAGAGFMLLLLTSALLPGCGTQEREAEAEQIISLQEGKETTLEGTEVSLKIESAWTAEEVEPENPSGYFYYYNDEEDSHYYVVKAKLTNPVPQQIQADMFGSSAWRGSEKLDTKLALESSDQSTFLEDDQPSVGSELGVYIITIVKDGEDEPDTVEFYYNEGLIQKEEGTLWEYGITADIN